MDKSFKDEDLALFGKCNLLDVGPRLPEYLAAVATTRWAILKKADNDLLTKHNITIKFEEEYQSRQVTDNKDDNYWEGIRKGRRFISKLYWILTKYEIVQPVQEYKSILSGLTITGEYAIIQKESETEKPLVLMLRENRPSTYLYPDVLSYAKWYHAKNNYLDVGIYNFCMFKGEDWKEKNLFEPLIKEWLYGILLSISSGNKHVTAGSHCSQCISKKCLDGYY
jgi:hypothetical protein